MSELEGRVIVITGAGRGIGREHALLFASEGARVVVNDLGGGPDGSPPAGVGSPAADVVAEIRAAGGTAVANGEDVADWTGSERLIGQAVDTFGRLDGLVNNAAIVRDAVLVNVTEDDWDISLRVNLRGHVGPTRAAARYWRSLTKDGQRVRASVVNTASESGVFGGAGQSSYAAAKSAVATLTEVWAKELSRYGVRVNAILPRARTRLTQRAFGANAMQPRQGVLDKYHPANASPWVAFLLTEGCAVTGQIFLAAGGVVQRVRPWEMDREWVLRKEGRWTIGELAKAVANVGEPTNEGRDTGIVR